MRRLSAMLLCSLGCTSPAPTLPDLAPINAVIARVQAENVLPLVQRLADDHVSDRKLECTGFDTADQYPACELSRDAAVAFVSETFEALGYSTKTLVQPGSYHDAFNVVAELPGVAHPEEVILLGAHVDAFYAGADDNSSGVAVMLEVARAVRDLRFARTVRFVGFDLEERGARGSTRYVEAGFAEDVHLAIILESVGYTARGPDSQDSPPGLELGRVGDSLAIAANEDSAGHAQTLLALNHVLTILPLRAVLAGGSGAYFFTGALLRSDNGPFWLARIPALMLTDTANYRNPHYHRASDTPETLDPAFMANTARLVAAAVAVFAEVQP